MRLESRHVQANESDERRCRGNFDGPQAEAAQFAIVAKCCRQYVALGRVEHAWEEIPSRADRHSSPRTPANRRLHGRSSNRGVVNVGIVGIVGIGPFYCDEDFLTTKDAK